MPRSIRKKKLMKRISRKRTRKNIRRKKHNKTMYGGSGLMKALAERLKQRRKRRNSKVGKIRGSKPRRIQPSEFSSNNEGEEEEEKQQRITVQANQNNKRQMLRGWWESWPSYPKLNDPNYVYGWVYYAGKPPYWTTKDIYGREVAIYTKPKRAIEPNRVILTGVLDGPWTKVEKNHQHAGGIIPADTKIITIDKYEYLTTLIRGPQVVRS